MYGKKLIGALVAACAIAASVAALAQGSSTKQTASKASAGSSSSEQQRPPGGMPGGSPGGGPGGGAVHSVSVVADKAGTSFITLTSDRGTVQSVDDSAGTIAPVEGTKSATYKTVTLTIPGEATVTLDGKTAKLSEVAAGDRVSVDSSSEGTTVLATDSSFQPQGGSGKGGPPDGHGPGGPPPGQEVGTETKSSSSTKSGTATSTTE